MFSFKSRLQYFPARCQNSTVGLFPLTHLNFRPMSFFNSNNKVEEDYLTRHGFSFSTLLNSHEYPP